MATTADEQASDPDLAAWVSGRRRVILQALRFHGGEANTSELREYTGLERGSFNHHMNALLNPPEDLLAGVEWMDEESPVEVVGEAHVGTPVPARQFGLTKTGERLFGELVDDVGVQASDVRDLRERVDELEAQSGGEQRAERDRIEKLEREKAANQERIEELEAENERIREAFNDLRSYVKSIEDSGG
jgi:predicted ribosome quality control (RQC) complex YloA/Tae2 family protein